MSYAPSTDFLALFRRTSGGIRSIRMPGLDYIVAGLARANMFKLWTGQTAPTSEQPITAWLRPASPSWASEGVVFLYDSATGQYELATPELWAALFLSSTSASVFQSVTGPTAEIASTTTLLAIQRNAPVTTELLLPSVSVRVSRAIQIVDWSSNIVAHEITLTPGGTPGDEFIMRRASFALLSSPDQLAGISLYPSPNLSGWVIAP